MVPVMSARGGGVSRLGSSLRPELTMTVTRSVADVLTERVSLEVESIDRLFLNLYQPRLMHAGGVASSSAPIRGRRLPPVR